jgi:hypothetical protein
LGAAVLYNWEEIKIVVKEELEGPKGSVWTGRGKQKIEA